jgi:hypothetical protein
VSGSEKRIDLKEEVLSLMVKSSGSLPRFDFKAMQATKLRGKSAISVLDSESHVT